MSISFREYYDMVMREINYIRERHRLGESIPIYEIQLAINHINHVLTRLPVGTSQENVPENAYNELVDIRDILQQRLDEQSAGRRKSKRKRSSKKKRKNIKRKTYKNKYKK